MPVYNFVIYKNIHCQGMKAREESAALYWYSYTYFTSNEKMPKGEQRDAVGRSAKRRYTGNGPF